MITIQELLYNRGLGKGAKVKLVRHKDGRYPLYEWYRSETDRQKFLTYQNCQGKDVFKDVDYIVSFIGEGSGTLSRFVGVFKIKNKKEFKKPIKKDGFDASFLYEMEEIRDFEDLKERVIIKWSNAISWHQWIKNEMEVIEIHPGLHYKQFTDYFEFILNFDELKDIVTNEYSDWKRMLSAINGIYVICDTRTGKQYVGSTYGENGIWGRWSKYINTNGHGDNKTLKELIDPKLIVEYA